MEKDDRDMSLSMFDMFNYEECMIWSKYACDVKHLKASLVFLLYLRCSGRFMSMSFGVAL
jgi:hypothetical protein